MEKECNWCQGPGKEFPNCKECEGNGWVHDEEDGGTKTCPECQNEDCSDCGGEGVVLDEEEENKEN